MTLSRFSSFFLLSLNLLLVACGDSSAPPPSAAAAVTVVTLKSAPVTLSRELPGRTVPFLIAEVRPQVSGLVKQQLFTEGGQVTAGELLYQIDDASYRADAASARAALARAQAALKSAQLTAARSSELAKIEAISRQSEENATAALRQAEADVDVARATLQNREVTLGYARITAPISGRIGKSSITRGALVTANQATALATVQQLDPIYVDLTPSSAGLLQLRKEWASGILTQEKEMPVTIALEDGSVYEHTGKITFSDLTVDPATGSFSLRVVVPNPQSMLLPGNYVRAIVSIGKREHALLVPQQGISRDAKGRTTAMVVGADGKVEQRAVQVSHTVGDKWLVDDGLVEGDRVIVAGLQKIRPGIDVQPTEATPASLPAAAPAVAP